MATILIVDDDHAVQEMMVDLLRGAGYDTAVCRDGRNVIETLENQEIDLVILDVLIPHLNGFALIDKIRNHERLHELPVIMISGIYRSRNHRKQMLSTHAILDYLDKPISTEHILGLIRDTVGPGDPEVAKRAQAQVEREKEKAPEGLSPVSMESTGDIPEPDADLIDSTTQQERQEVEAEARQDFRTNVFLMQGSIRRKPVVAVLGKLWHDKRTGALLLRRGKVKKIIYLKNGEPQQVKSNLIGECLGQILMSERMISKEDCAESVRRMKQSGKKQGEVLIEMRSLTAKNVSVALELQIERKLFDTFAWENGEYRFNASTAVPENATHLEWAGPALVTEGVRRAFDETRLRKLMLPILDVPLVFRDEEIDWGSLGLTKQEQRAVAQIDLPQTTRELLDSVPLDPPDTLRVLYTLIALQMLEPG